MSELRDVIRRELTDAGACAVGFASAGMVDDAAWDAYMSWLDSGSAGELGYMHRNLELRRDARTAGGVLYSGMHRVELSAGRVARQRYAVYSTVCVSAGLS